LAEGRRGLRPYLSIKDVATMGVEGRESGRVVGGVDGGGGTGKRDMGTIKDGGGCIESACLVCRTYSRDKPMF
jgi:hypothetical protein